MRSSKTSSRLSAGSDSQSEPADSQSEPAGRQSEPAGRQAGAVEGLCRPLRIPESYFLSAVPCFAEFGLSGVAGRRSQGHGGDAVGTRRSQEILETTKVPNVSGGLQTERCVRLPQ